MRETPTGSWFEPRPAHRLLLVEHDESSLHSISVMLAAHFDFITRRDGGDALDCIDDQKPDLVLCEWALPDMQGLELVDRVRRRLGPRVPRIVMADDPDAQAPCWDAGVEAFILKPFNRAELLGLLEAVTRRSLGS